jgi:hypothetical protein
LAGGDARGPRMGRVRCSRGLHGAGPRRGVSVGRALLSQAAEFGGGGSPDIA